MKKKKGKFKFPDFDKMTYEEEANWWDSHDWSEFWDELEDVELVVSKDFKSIYSMHEPKQESLSVRLPAGSKLKLAEIAKSKGVNVSTLARIWLTQMIQSAK
jgi:hypothetical protein